MQNARKGLPVLIIAIILIAPVIAGGESESMSMVQVGDYYEEYNMYHMDVNYHLGNSYLLFVESTGTRLVPMIQGVMGEFTGTYDMASVSDIYDMDTGAMPPELPPKGYYTPTASMLIWLGIAIAMLLLGIIKFNRKEIS